MQTNIKLVISNAAFGTKSQLHKNACWFTFYQVLFDKMKHKLTQYFCQLVMQYEWVENIPEKFKETFEINKISLDSMQMS